MESLKYALNYAKLNFKVFPLKVNTKDGHICKSWKKEATTNETIIRNMWKENYNVAVVTGNGLMIIDVDVKNGKDGLKSIEPFLDKFPKTFTVKTPNGGYHYWYLVNKEVPCKVNLYDGIDIRGEGGYIIAPPSIVDNKSYEIINNHPIAAANDAVYEFLYKEEYTKVSSIKSNEITAGSRNDTLFKIACSLHSKGICDEAILACLLKENEVRCNPSLLQDEVERIVNSVINRYPKGRIQIFSESKNERISASQLMKMKLTYTPNIVDNLVAVGVNLFGAPPKSGKTFFSLQMANCVASGTPFLGNDTKKGTVYYLALEDIKQNIQKRLKNFKTEISPNLIINFGKAYDKTFDLESTIVDLKKEHPDLNMIVIDTFEKIREEDFLVNTNKYSNEYKEFSKFHELGVKYNLAILLIMHLKKAIDRNNPFDALYGSRGVTAGADGMMVMLNTSASSKIKELFISGKEIPEDRKIIYQNENLLFELCDDDIEIDQADRDLISIIQYVVRKKNYKGTMSQLCSIVNVETRPNQMSSLLKKHKNILDEYFVDYKQLKKTAKERPIQLTYYGEDEN